MVRVNIIGTGKVGRTLMMLFGASQHVEVIDVLARTPENVDRAVAQTGVGRAVHDLSDMRAADVWILSVPDDAIADVAQGLAETVVPTEGAVAVHCSGFLSSEVLAPLRSKGWGVASCHPVLSFADPVIAARMFPRICCAVEGDEGAAAVVSALVRLLEATPFAVDTAHKALYHAAAVFSNNFTTVMQAVAREAWEAAGVSPEIADRLGSTLLDGTAEAVARLGPAAALTGPAARGDREVMEKQQAEVAAWHPEAGALYEALSALAVRLKATGKTRP